MEQFYEALRNEGLDLESYRKQIREEITLARLIDREINNRITVSDTEVENFLTDRKRESRVDDAYDLSHILVAVPESATSDDIRAARF
ncbi:MAG: molecular chaperone SurA, partial [Burkholderiales bacterium]|nr:molecular chaperone SurA [Burkholderiales bacterium]